MKSSTLHMSRTIPIALALLGSAATHAQVVFTVGSGGTHQSIQSAVDACPSKGCVIQLTDTDYDLPREIWIENKDNLAIEPSPALVLAGKKPRLHSSADLFKVAGTSKDTADPLRPAGWKQWPNKGSTITEAGGAGDTANPYSTTGFQYNGLIVVDSSRDVRIEGLRLDGVRVTTFANVAIWNDMYDVFFGSVGVNLMRSKNVTVRDCEISNFFAAIYMNGRNPGGFTVPRDSSTATNDIAPGSKSGAVGDHLIEGNVINGNWYAFFDESEWDLGSTIRFNRCFGNRNFNLERGSDKTAESNTMIGGFLYVKDVPIAIHRIHNNTIWGSPLVIGHGYFRPGVQHLFYNNVVGGFDRLGGKLATYVRSDYQLMMRYTNWLESNLFEVGSADTLYTFQKTSSGPLDDSVACAGAGQLSPPCYLPWDAPVEVMVGIRNQWLWNGWQVKRGGTYTATYGDVPRTIPSATAIEQFPGGGLIEQVMDGATPVVISTAKNRWVKTLSWASLDTGNANLLTPVWGDELVKRVVKGQGRIASGTETGPIDLGAISASGIRPTIHGLRSQLPPFFKEGGCWDIPLIKDFETTGGSITSVTAWNVPGSANSTSTSSSPKMLPVLPLSDSSLSKASVNICLYAGTPTEGTHVRFQIESSAKLKNGTTVAQEPAYFLAALSNSPMKAVRAIRTGNTRLSRLPHALEVAGLADGTARMSLRTLDGRLLREISAPTRKGAISLDVLGLPRGPVVVQVRQGELSWSSLTSLF